MKTTIYFVRHGQSVANLRQRVAGTFDLGLSREGRLQAKALAKHFKKIHLDAVYSSHLPRAEATAMFTAKQKGLPLHIEPRVMEFNFGDLFEGVKNMDAFNKDKERFSKYLSKTEFVNCEFPNGGENPTVCAQRVVEGIKSIARKNVGKSVLVVGHSVALMCFIMYVKNGYSLKGATRDVLLPNASITTLEIENDNIEIKEIGFTGHLKRITREKETIK